MASIAKSAKQLRDGLVRFRNGDTLRYTSVATAKHTLDPAYTTISSTAPGSLYVTRRYHYYNSDLEVPTRRVVLRVRPSKALLDSAIADFSYFLGRFATTPASLTWELIPWSFVADWFVDVRGGLRALDNMLGFCPYEVLSLSLSHTFMTETSSTISEFTPCNGSLIQGPDRTCVVRYKHYERHPISDNQLIVWRNRFGKNQAADTAALITQELLRANRKRR
jgi:hypothetical protein